MRRVGTDHSAGYPEGRTGGEHQRGVGDQPTDHRRRSHASTLSTDAGESAPLAPVLLVQFYQGPADAAVEHRLDAVLAVDVASPQRPAAALESEIVEREGI